ncbi:phosphate ABC transporter substrate-binding protein PstS family protein [Halobium salinum]|uniref:Phosphate ABC transporter substrate-binding protein PstS family protein n=1 Tax=Halobium salinum TaxID=1364940 RepID=A0ABD5P8U9_9EURY|nr:PstS family phosphate ABC transporter substrate-binding protein [Halobium salinum]
MTEESSDKGVSRRKLIAAAGTVGAVGIAGCTSNTNAGGESGGSENGSGSEGGSGNESGNESGSGQLSGTIDVAGSSTVFPLATAMAEEFRKDHPDVKINIQSTGSGGGFANHFCPGRTDFNNASRPIKEEEKASCQQSDINPVELNVATDALTVVVSPENDFIDCLTLEQLKQIWSGESKPTTWSEVNSDWPDEQIELFGPTDASGTFDYFKEAVLGEETNHRNDYQSTEQDRTIIQGVSKSQYAIGYLGYAYYSENKDTVKAVSIDNGDGQCVKPSLETAKSGKYKPLSRPLFTYPAKESLAEEHVAEFAKFWIENATSEEIVADQVGYVPLDEEQQKEQMTKLESAISEAQGN